MRIKLDENLPASLVEALVQLGHNADSVQQEGLSGVARLRRLDGGSGG